MIEEQETKQKSLREEMKELKEIFEETEKKKSKERKFKIPRRARINKRKMKQGYVTIAVVRDNKNVDFIKEKLDNSTYKLDGDTYHVSDEESVYFHKGKPIVFQPKKRQNPVNLLKDNNETYGHKLIMARMLTDRIKPKGNYGALIIWVILGIGVLYFASQYIG